MLLLIGAGGHGRSVLDSIDRDAFGEIAFIEKKEMVGQRVYGIEVVGTNEDLSTLFKQGYNNAFITVGSVGNPIVRVEIYNLLIKIGYNLPSLIDKTAIVSENATISEGVFIGKGAVINAGAVINTCCIINTGTIIEHDCHIGNFTHVAPGVRIAGNVTIGENTHIGIGSTVIQQINIGADTLIGAGSVVVSDIPSGIKAFGVPCKKK